MHCSECVAIKRRSESLGQGEMPAALLLPSREWGGGLEEAGAGGEFCRGEGRRGVSLSAFD